MRFLLSFSARIQLYGLEIDVYATHVSKLLQIFLKLYHLDIFFLQLHAEYGRNTAAYLPHRTLQAYELGEFVNETTNGGLAIVLGDFNVEPTDPCYPLIISTAGLSDAYETRMNKVSENIFDRVFFPNNNNFLGRFVERCNVCIAGQLLYFETN